MSLIKPDDNIVKHNLYKIKTRAVQPRPYSKPLPYNSMKNVERHGKVYDKYGTHVTDYEGNEVSTSFVTYHGSEREFVYGSSFISRIKNQNARGHINNKALSNIDEKLRVAESFFEDWYERKQAYSMGISAVKHVLDFAKNWKNPRWYKDKRKAAKLETLPQAWLLYNFGLKPVIGTLDRALTSIATPLPSGLPVFGAANGNWLAINKMVGNPAGTLATNVECIRRVGCIAHSNPNPNTHLAGLTGLNEPFSSAWNVIPWGWAVDYFVNVGDMLSNLEVKHPGIYTSDWYTTDMLKYSWDGKLDQYGYYGGSYTLSGSGHRITRTLSEPNYEWTLDFPLLGSGRFANLTSALAMTLKGSKK